MIMFKNKGNVSYEIKNDNGIIKFLKRVKKNTVEEKMLFNEYNFLINNSNGTFPQVFDFYDNDEYTVLELEYIEGKQINKLIFTEIKDKLIILYKLLEIIKIIHSKGFVHCDINPNNIIITNENEVKLIDFGLVTKIRNKNSFNYGTLRYVSKEQLNNQALDERTDIYAVCILMLECLFDFDLYGGKNKNEVVNMKNSNSYFDVMSKLNVKNDYNLVKIINKCIQNEIDLRYKNIDDLLQDLKILLEGDINE